MLRGLPAYSFGGFTFAVPGRGTALVFIAALAHNYTSDVTWHNGSKQQHHVKLINILKEGCPWSRDRKGGAINGELQGTRKRATAPSSSALFLCFLL